jgi:hypothetical protein
METGRLNRRDGVAVDQALIKAFQNDFYGQVVQPGDASYDIRRAPHERQQQNLVELSHLRRWFEAIGARRAVQRTYEIAASINQTPVVTEQSRAQLFGQTAG